MARDDENKREFSSTSRILREAIKPAAQGSSIMEDNSKNQLPEEMKPIWSLNPDSREFKRRINEVNFKYFMELNNIYLINILLTKQTQQEARDKNALLAEYHHHLEEIKQFFQNLSSEKPFTEKLYDEQMKRLELLKEKIEEGIKVLTRQIEQLDLIIEKTNDDIKKLMEEKQNQKIKFVNILQEYFSDEVIIKNADRIVLPITFNPEEIAKSEKVPPSEFILNEKHIRAIIQDVTGKIMRDEFSFAFQANDIQNVVREHLHNEVMKVAAFLPKHEKEIFADQFMKSREGARGIDTISTIISDHIEEKEAQNQYQLKVIEQNSGQMDSELHEKLEQKEFLTTFRDSLVEEKEIFSEISNNIKTMINEDTTFSSTSNDLQTFNDNLDDIFGDDSPAENIIATFSQESLTEEETASNRFTRS